MKDFLNSPNVFCPISVGNPKFSKNLFFSLGKWAEKNSLKLNIVLFDSLRVLTNILKGHSSGEAKRLAKKSATEQSRMIDKALSKYSVDFNILMSSDLVNEIEIVANKEKLRSWAIENPKVFSKTQELSERTFENLGFDKTVQHRFVQFEYIIEETSIALTIVSKLSVLFELHPTKEGGFIDYLFEINGRGFSDKGLLSSGRKFRSWNEEVN